MKHFALEGKLRTDLGKTASRQLRKQELVPCVLYGNGNNVNFLVNDADIRNLVFTPNVYLVDLKIEGKDYQSIIKDLQFDPVSSEVIHIDFLSIRDDKPVSINVPLIFVGQSIGVKIGGKLKTNQRIIHLRALPANLPDVVEIDISNLNVNQSIKVKDVVIENVELLEKNTKVLVAVISARGVDAAAAEGAAE